MYKFVTKQPWCKGSDVNAHHQEIMKIFPYGEKVRFRMDEDTITVISPEFPAADITANMTSIPTYKVGQALSFRIKIVAAKKDYKTKAMRPIKKLPDLMSWFKGVGKKNGFKITDWSKIDLQGGTPCMREIGTHYYNAVDFAGGLIVEDPNLFNKAVCGGIGHAKSFGFGVLDVFDI